ncbi:arsenic resistance protein [Gilvimarinus xylanilyticus]|jgi:ACR3 family arsenite efflux pump ArsB|uniref:Arsenic resistance protein n=1 Tax=Gilvimarinus xylanilyticus TaxID=2944139 RepID=A0A9X2HWS7_9GAMM|nr:arsenic resistance protein [Gilvimarinus xylanilyticus]MCP8898479.1 arsenic resistance protein [Gilvimarinus xylanilyticus]
MREKLEQYQVWIYLVAILAGMAIGWKSPGHTSDWELLLWPVLGILLYSTFTQVPLIHLTSAFRDRRFLAALLTGNFVLIPVIVGALLLLLPDEPAIRLGVLLVLLVPCTDWFISFTHLGGGDGARAIAAAPVLLIVQLILLPVYIWLFMGDLAIELAAGSHLLPAFFGLIVTPLILAWVTERLSGRHLRVQRLVGWLGWLPVPLLALVVFLIAGSQVSLVIDNSTFLWSTLAAFALYLLLAAFIGKGLSELFALTPAAGRTLTFSLGTRNSFVMLPLALSLPEVWSAAVVVIVFQSLVELFGMVAYLRWVPRYLIKDASGQ